MNLRKMSVILLAFLLAGMAMVPMVSATEQSPALANTSMTISGLQLQVVDSKVSQGISESNSIPLTRAQFIKTNQRYIDLLAKKFGNETALKIADNEYSRISAQKSSVQTVSPSVVSSTPLQIGGYNIYLWPYNSESASQTDPAVGPITFVFYHNALDLMTYLSGHGWTVTFVGWDEWGYHGSSSSSLHWSDSNLGTGIWGQLQQGSEFGDRYHTIITAGDYSSSLGSYWSYGNCHHEYYSNGQHIVYANGWNQGRSQLYSTLSGGYSAYWVSLYNSMSGYWDGWGQIFR
jgi:hypothetical protein